MRRDPGRDRGILEELRREGAVTAAEYTVLLREIAAGGAPAGDGATARPPRRVVKGSGQLQLFVAVDGKDAVAVDVAPGASVADVKQQLAAGGLIASARGALSYVGRELRDAQLLSDEGVGQEAMLTLDSRCNVLIWGRQGADWDTEGVRARRVRKSQGWTGGGITTDPAFRTGRHMWALRVRIVSHGSTNFTVGIAGGEVSLDDQIYCQVNHWGVIDHSDAYASKKSHHPRRGFKPNNIIVCCLDLVKGWFNLWRDTDGETGHESGSLRANDYAEELARFDNVRLPECGTLHASVCTLASGGSGDTDGYGADIVQCPDWALGPEFLDTMWPEGSSPLTVYVPQSQ